MVLVVLQLRGSQVGAKPRCVGGRPKHRVTPKTCEGEPQTELTAL